MSTKKTERIERKKRKLSAFLKLVEEDEQKRPRLDECEFQELRAKLKERKKKLQEFPKFDLKSQGHDASIDVLFSQRKPLFFQDLQNLLSFAMIGDRSSYKPYSWCKLEKWNKVKSMSVLVMDNLGLDDYISNREDLLRHWEPLFPYKLHFLSPQPSLPKEFALLSLSSTLKYNIVSKMSLNDALFSKTIFNFPVVTETEQALESSLKLKLLLNPRQMLECSYPMPIPGYSELKYAHYVPTFLSYDRVTNESPLFCIDCEMCLTVSGKLELTSICIVDEKLNVLYHSLVKPSNHIINYLTQYSGITKELLKDVTTTLEDVQNKIIEILSPDSILVGHSLNSDMDAIQMMHPYVIDTSQIYNLTGNRQRRSKLALLTKLFLNKEIQNAGASGHCPMEDAISTMELALLKLKNGYSFGDTMMKDSQISHEMSKIEDEYKASFFDINCKEKELQIIGVNESLHEYEELLPDSSILMQTKSINQCYKAACESAASKDLTLCHIPFGKLDDVNVKKLWKITKRVWKSVPSNSLFFNIWPGRNGQDAFVGIAMKEDPKKKQILKE
ncbi:RNA exonuclease 5 [Lepeophtheirus salmonis]|uniref:RNA exonuclease 5 n=1 Tax=Lepeophtheirus salmonis TaxID=72036 RepID=UPI001AEB90AC|nr:RNA exonuclease 5-like [Lepeophtheirus salmonis]